jgi:hypothetical protein
MSDSSFYRRKRIQRALTAGSALVFVAGVVAALVVFVGNTSSKTTDTPLSTVPAVTTPQKQNVKLDPAARVVAGKFILTAVTRKDLAAAYELTDPQLRQGLTKQQWLTGNIPIQYYPADAIDTATFKIDESYPNEAVLEVALIPKQGETVKPQIFFIGLKKTGDRWQVYYWAPRASVALPNAGDG